MTTNSAHTEPYQGAAIADEKSTSRGTASSQWQTWLPFAAIAILMAVIYYRVGVKLVYDWYTIPDYSHGFLVPLFSLFLLWDKREALRDTPVRQSWAGVPLVILSIVILIL